MVSIIAVGAFLKFTPNSLLCSRRLKSRSRCRNIHLGHMIPPPPPQVLKVNSLRVFFLGFVMAGRSFLLIGKRKEQFILTALSLIRFYLILEYCRLDLTNIRFRNHHIHLKHNLRRLLYFPLRHETFYL